MQIQSHPEAMNLPRMLTQCVETNEKSQAHWFWYIFIFGGKYFVGFKFEACQNHQNHDATE